MSRTRHHGDKAKKSAFGNDWMSWGWMQNYPKWHDRMFHTKPRRARERQAIKRATDDLSADVLHPLDHKPHKYYW